MVVKQFFFIAIEGYCQSITSLEKNYFVGRVERDIALPISLGEELYDMVS
jgi:hypothetical protein